MAAMQRIELEDEPDVVAPRRRRAGGGGPGAGGGEDGRGAEPGDRGERRRMRPGLVAVVAGALVLVLGLVVAQGVLDARERARAARWAELAGTLAPLGDTVTPGWSIAADRWVSAFSRDDELGADVAIGLRAAEDGSLDAVATRLPDGTELWATRIGGPQESRGGDPWRGGTGTRCERDEVATTDPVCLVTDRYSAWSDDGEEVVHAGERAELVVLDGADGTPVRRWDVPLSDGFALLGTVAAVWTLAEDGAVDVHAYDVATGRESWSQTLAAPDGFTPFEGASSPVWGAPVGSGLRFWWDGTATTVVVLDADGERVTVPDGMGDVVGWPGTDTWYFADLSGARTVVTRAGRADVEVDGQLIGAQVDDGSLGELLLTDGDGLASWDPVTGRQRWSTAMHPSGSPVVLGGVVYVVTGSDLVALDGATGEERWRRTVVEEQEYSTIATDGRRLYVTSIAGLGDGYGAEQTSRLHAISLDGEEVHEIALPDGTSRLIQFGRYFWALPEEGETAAVLS